MPPKRKRQVKADIPLVSEAILIPQGQARDLLQVIQFLDPSNVLLDTPGPINSRNLRDILSSPSVGLEDVKKTFDAIKHEQDIQRSFLNPQKMTLDSLSIITTLLQSLGPITQSWSQGENNDDSRYVLHRQLGDVDVFTSSFTMTGDDFSILSDVKDVDLIAIPSSTISSQNASKLSSYIRTTDPPPPLPAPRPPPPVSMLYYDPFSSFAPSYDSQSGHSTYSGAVRAWEGREALEEYARRSSEYYLDATMVGSKWDPDLQLSDRGLTREVAVEMALQKCEDLLKGLQEGQNNRMRKKLVQKAKLLDDPSREEQMIATELIETLMSLVSLVNLADFVNFEQTKKMMNGLQSKEIVHYGSLDKNNVMRVVL